MHYKKLIEIPEKLVSRDILRQLDEFLAEVSPDDSEFIYPEQVSAILNIQEDDVLKVFLACSQYYIMSTRYEAYCPNDDVGFYYTFDKNDLKKLQECNSCNKGYHTPESDCDIYVSFRLNEIKNINKKTSLEKKNPIIRTLQQVRHLIIQTKLTPLLFRS